MPLPPPPQPKHSSHVWHRRLRLAAASVLALLVLGWLAVVLWLAPFLQQQLQVRGSAALGRTLTVGEVQWHAWPLALQLSDIRVASADGSSTQFQIGGVYVALSAESLLRMAPVIDALRVDQPRVHLTRLAVGHYDVDDLLQRFASAPQPATPSPELPRFALYNVQLSDGAMDFADHAGPQERTHTLRRLNFSIPFLSTLPARRDVLVQPRLTFELNGSTFSTEAQARPFASARDGEASLHIAQLDVAPYLTYLPATLPLQLQGAVLDTTLNLRFAQSPLPSLHISGAVELSKVRLANRQGANLLQMGSVRAVLGDVEPLRQHIGLESLTLTQPQLQLARSRTGVLNIAELLGPTAPPPAGRKSPPAVAGAAAPADPAAGASGWHLELARLLLQQGQLHWSDESTKPAAELVVADTALEVRNLAWPMDPAHAAEFQGALTLARPGVPDLKPASLHFDGHGVVAAGKVSLHLSDLGLPLAAPYLADYLVPGVRGSLDAEVQAAWEGSHYTLQVAHASLRDAALVAPATAPRPDQRAGQRDGAPAGAEHWPAIKRFEIQDLALDLSSHQVQLGQLVLDTPRLWLERGADGQWQFERWLKSAGGVSPTMAGAPTTPAKPAPPAAPPWVVRVADLRLDGGMLTLHDLQPARAAFLEFSGMQLHASQLALDGKRAAPLHFSTQVRSGRTEPGTVRFDGSAMWAPVRVQGRVAVAQLPLHSMAPYLQEQFPIDLMRADATFTGQLRYADLPAGADFELHGGAALDDVKVNSVSPRTGAGPAPAEQLLSWSHLAVPDIALTLHGGAPAQLAVGDVTLNDLFVRLSINPQGRLVLQDLMAPATPANPASAAATPVAAAAPATAAPAVAPASASAPVIAIGPIHLVNGQVAFADHFIQPNYSADLTDLNGSLGRFATRSADGSEVSAPLELRGHAQGSASLEVVGRVNPLVRPLDLDIQAHVKDLELSPLTSYAAKYAGYGIERGKLSVDLSYRIQPDASLHATNHIVLDQLTFGTAVPGAANSLPVKLVTALLADRNGVINLDLPISGSLDDPQFSIWPVVWKILGNLITKAITSPFSLFSSLGGGNAPDPGNVAFEPGSAQLAAAGRQSLEQLAGALRDRPSLLLTITGVASAAAEDAAIRRNRLHAMLLVERQRSAGSARGTSSPGSATMAPAGDTVSAQEYPALLQAVYRRADIKKPRNLLGLTKDLPPQQMEELLLASINITPDDVHSLALQRAVAVRDYLERLQLPAGRLFVGPEKLVAGDDGWVAHAELGISNN